MFSDKHWYENFRVTRATFVLVLEEIREHVSRRDTIMRKFIPVERRLILILYYLASTAEYMTMQICLVFQHLLFVFARLIKFPHGEELVENN